MSKTTKAQRSMGLDVANTQPIPSEWTGYAFEWREGFAHGFVGSTRYNPVGLVRALGEDDEHKPRDAWAAGRAAAQRLVKLQPAQEELLRSVAFAPAGNYSIGGAHRGTAHALEERGIVTISMGYLKITPLGDLVLTELNRRP